MSGSTGITLPNIDERTIYEGGNLNAITVEDLENNPIAIRQLLNTHNIKVREATQQQIEIIDLKAELEYQKTTPFIAIVSACISIAGTIVLGIAINQITSTSPPAYSSTLLYTGAFLLFLSALVNILFPYARTFFNKKKEQSF